MDLIKLSIQRPIFVSMVTLFLVAIGGISLSKLPVDLYPDVSYPVLAVRANLDGAAPEEVEQLVAKRMEDTLSTIAGVQSLRSISREGSATVVMEFVAGTDVRFQEMQVRAKIANIRRQLPEEVSEPVVFRQDPDDTPIIEIAVTGDRPASSLTKIAEDDIARLISQVPGVGQVDIGGSRKPEIRIELRQEALDAWHISASSVVAAIKQFNRNDPVGKLEGKDRMWVLRSLSPIKSVNDLGQIRVASDSSGTPIFLRDIADIIEGFAEISNETRVGTPDNLKAAVLVDVLKQSGENSLKVSDNVRAAIEKIQKNLPNDVNIKITRDNADLVRVNVKDVVESIVIGAILTVLVVLLFLRSPRSTITTGLALPTSIITTFAAMTLFGFTINVMTLLAISLAVGLLIDDAIVVRENIFRHLSSLKAKAKDAAYFGTKEVILAVMATTLTIVAVFVPVGFMGGVSGQFFKQFALTVVFAILVATWDALTMAPMLSAYFANYSDPGKEWKFLGRFGAWINNKLIGFEHFFDGLAQSYSKLLKWLIPRRWVATAFALSAAAVAIAGFIYVPKSFLPTQLGDTFSGNLSGALAVPMVSIQDTTLKANEKLKAVPSLEYWTMRSGSGFNGAANIRFTFKVKAEYGKNQKSLAAVRQEVRQTLSGFPGYQARLSEPSDPLAGGGGGGRFQPVAVEIAGDDIVKLREVGGAVRQILLDLPGATDVGTIDDQGLPEVRMYTDPALAAQYQTNASVIGDALKIWVEGDTSNSLRVGDDQIPIRVKLKGGDSMSPQQLIANNLYLRPNAAKPDVAVPLVNMVHWEAGAGPPIIVRENRQRTLRIGANLAQGAALGDVVSSLEDRLADVAWPDGYRARIVGQNEQMSELTGNLVWAIALGSLFVYMVLASLFESFTQPLTVMMAIPLAATGAVLALLGFGLPLDLYGGIGMILLAGIVAKNSILLIDFAMQKIRESGTDPRTAIIESAPIRLRPILMTSIAMIAGMIPIATGWGAGGAARQSLGIATIGGIVSSTILTLLVVPNLFIFIEDFNGWWRKRQQTHAHS
jgi:HAE1 family hydrophobic/amphiphilic exporter-1